MALERISFDVPTENLVGVFAPHPVAPLADLGAALDEALAQPIGAPSLVELARGARSVLLVVDDNTRPTPTERLLPPILDRLNAAGVPDAAIELLIALGTHRPMTPAEQEIKYGREVLRRVRVSNHDAFDPARLVDLGGDRRRRPRHRQSCGHGGRFGGRPRQHCAAPHPRLFGRCQDHPAGCLRRTHHWRSALALDASRAQSAGCGWRTSCDRRWRRSPSAPDCVLSSTRC